MIRNVEALTFIRTINFTLIQNCNPDAHNHSFHSFQKQQKLHELCRMNNRESIPTSCSKTDHTYIPTKGVLAFATFLFKTTEKVVLVHIK